jgi:hypothetical protein
MPYESTPVDYEPYNPTSWEGDEDAGAKHDRVPPVESFTPPLRRAKRAQHRWLLHPRQRRALLGRGIDLVGGAANGWS